VSLDEEPKVAALVDSGSERRKVCFERSSETNASHRFAFSSTYNLNNLVCDFGKLIHLGHSRFLVKSENWERGFPRSQISVLP
jgi:hypothetical protein